MQIIAPESIAEEYYQINEAILSSFPKYRPPLDLFLFKEDIAQLQRLVKKDTRITNDQIDQIFAYCRKENLFVSRADFPIYSTHIVKQPDLVLVDRNLKPGEVADITLTALAQRLAAFYEQPVKLAYDALHEAALVVTEYVWQDHNRLGLYMQRLFTGDHSLVRQALNAFSVGLWLFCRVSGAELHRRQFDRVAAALLIHDVGMAKVPAFILGKTSPLKPDEKEKIPHHPMMGMKVVQKLDVMNEEIRAIIMEHQERMDGSGYPHRLRKNEISWLGRLSATADSFAAMIQKRPYAAAIPPEKAARVLASDITRYDSAFTAPLASACTANNFSL